MKPQKLEVAVALVEGRHIFCRSPRDVGKKKNTLKMQWHQINI